MDDFLHSSGPDDSERDPAVVREKRKDELVLGYRVFGAFGWGDDGAGHISARDPERLDCFWLLGYGIPFRHARREHLVLIDGDGKILEGSRDYNPAAYRIHMPIHEARPDVVSVAHTHTPYGTPFAALARPMVMSSQESCAFYNDQAVFYGEEVDVTSYEAGERLAAAMGPAKLLILANHGLLTAGASVAEAVGAFVLAERASEVQVKTPNARVISDTSAAAAFASVGTRQNLWHTFHWCARSRVTFDA